MLWFWAALIGVVSVMLGGCAAAQAETRHATGIDLSPSSILLPAGASQVFVATAVCSDGQACAIAGQLEWSSSDVSVATVDPFGRASALAIGSAIISALDPSSGAIGTAKLTVSAALLRNIALTPSEPNVPAGKDQVLVATGTYEDGATRDISALVQWSSEDPIIVEVDSGGLAHARSLGSAKVTAADMASGIRASVVFNVIDPLLTEITLSAASPVEPVGMGEQLTAMGTFSDGSKKDISSSLAWSSSDPDIASVDDNGAMRALKVGVVTIAATDALHSMSGTTVITVTPPVLVSLDISPASPVLPKGISQQLVATGTFSDGAMLDVTSFVSWSSSDPITASVDASGNANALAVGSALITAADPKTKVSAAVTVVVVDPTLMGITVSPSSPSLAAGGTQLFTATGVYTDGSTADLTAKVGWSSSDTTIATVSADAGTEGLVTAVAAGITTIRATDVWSGIFASADLTVTP